ncbi:PREDICTED: uncharacterized protein LOC105961450 [Erythranthe guttata]|uniref:uncharacterized protein LOC105961450 n=1 Tax=Erythranthe guttata TaxID=4155 RepID=UPI00064E0A4F|nr:PREDICTED: uncharacterized protein LOC105961450 [Erythranthe guttata]|eukprot:XP_012841137.1 PREDICTED: uncharacterized protein LOC105961450 [Erythranthe guttata]
MHEEVTSPFTEVASNAVALASTNEKCQKPPITKWLLRAQMIPGRRSEGLTIYDPVCSELHELKHVPNCIHCHAVRFEYEPKTFCCGNGKVRVAPIEMPDEMYDLFVSESEEAVTFRKNIRALNCIFSFTLLGVKLDKDLASAKHGVYTFRAQGMVYHDLPGLTPNEAGPTNFQLYFVETEKEIENRLKILDNSELSEPIINKVMKIMEVNPYARLFRTLKDYPSMDNVQLHISKDVRLDQRVYNSPTADQVAAIWVEGNDPHIPAERDIVVHARSGHKHRIKHYYGCYDPMQYPLLFPKGDTGWHQNIPKIGAQTSNTIISSYTEQQRANEEAAESENITSSYDVLAREQQEWAEIQENLYPGQKAQDRPDLTSRVFRAKLQDLKDQLFKKEILGKVAAHVHVIEFQKRGLPHAHMLIILKSEYKITTPDTYDRFVSAELPDPEKHPALHALVVKHMMHGPCGSKNKSNSCMVDEKCKYHYPRPYCESTIQGKDGYPIYKRRRNGITVQVRRAHLNNQWVVPYNPYLLSRYNCHINVEICSGVTAVKYLYKYIYKGHDRVAVNISQNDEENNIDEIKEYQDARWVSAQEAIWRIYEFNLNEISPPVIDLHLHLPNQQCVTYWANQNLSNVLKWDHVSKTMLTEYFSMCSRSEKARKYLYKEFPEYYVWDKQGRCWSERKKRDVIGRIHGANPMEGERYYLRLLLNHVRGPTSFLDLLTVNGIRCANFKEASQKRGLLESDQSVIECLNEAITFQMPHELRRLFATVLVYCAPTDVRVLWDTYFEAMSEDFRKENDTSKERQITRTLQSVNYFLESMGKKLESYDLPSAPVDTNHVTTNLSREIEDELSIEIPSEDYEAEKKLNKEQQDAFKVILEFIHKGKAGMFFIDGPGGTGKTFLYRALLAHLRSRKKIAIATATSGVAAAIMPGGRTAHSRFKIPIDANESSDCNISKQSGVANLLRTTKLIIWDEAPMAKRWAIENVDKLFKDIMGNDEHFGGKVVVFGGDFRQVLPVVPRGTIHQTISASLVKSRLWHKMIKFSLSKNMRAQKDPEFGDFLLRVGNGEETSDIEGNIIIPEEMVVTYDNEEDSMARLIHSIFPSLSSNAESSTYMTTRAILASKNEEVDKLNDKLISMFPGDARTFQSFDEAIDDTNNNYEEDFLNSLTPNGLPPHKLVLKRNCPIILLRNLDPSNGLCNGTRMVCRNFKSNVIDAEIVFGQHVGKHVFIPRIPLSPAENEGYPFKFKRKQFPIRLCFAMTINKAQGQTIPNIGVYLPQPVFSPGQLYVALSRGTSSSTTKVLIKPDTNNVREKRATKNVVYKEVLNADLEYQFDETFYVTQGWMNSASFKSCLRS